MKLLIVDDEEDVRNGIRGMIDWQANGIEVCGEAEDGERALHYASLLQPDILLMDIRMPEMNGLQVAEALKEAGNAAKIILLSGYDDFVFAQQALKFGVSEYLLKPCLPEEILATVLKLKTDIRQEREKRDMYASIQAMFDEQLQHLKESFLLKCLRNELASTEDPKENFDIYKIKLPPRQANVTVVRIDDYGDFVRHALDRDVAFLRLSVRNAAEAFVGSRLRLEVIDDQDDIVLVSHLASEDDESALLEGLSRMQEELKTRLGFTVSVGTGRTYADIGQLHLSYSEAVQAMEARFALGVGCLIRYDELAETASPAPNYPFSEEKQIVHSVKNGNYDGLERQIDAFFAALGPGSPSRDHVARCCMALLLSLYHLCLETRSNPDDIFGKGLASIDELVNATSLQQMKANVLSATEAVSRKINSRKTGHKTIEQAVDYIQTHYANELTLETVSNSVYVNPNYFCLLFKQTMNIKFIDYIHKVRIEKACEGLEAYPYKTYEIAAKVGYANEKYFCQIFKKHTGLTPSQYRERFTAPSSV